MRPWVFLLALLMLALGGTLAWQGRAPGVRVEEGRLENEAGEALQTWIYLPACTGAPCPGLLLCHGIDSSKENMDPLALAFAERGFVALVFDFGGHGESYARRLSERRDLDDARRAFAALTARAEVDRSRLAVVGFSMGAPPAVQVAGEEAGVRAVVALGRAVAVPASWPHNFLLAAGTYDQFQNRRVLLSALRSSVARPDAVAGKVYGSLAAGTARQLILSPYTDHPLSPYDPLLMASVVGWVEQACGLTRPTPSAPGTELRPAARTTFFAGSVLLFLGLLHRLLSCISPAWLRSPVFRRGVAVAGVGICVAPLLLAQSFPAATLLGSDAAVLAVFVMLGINLLLYRHAERDRPWQEMPAVVFRPVLGMAAVVAASWTAGLLLHRAGELVHFPTNLLGLPGLATEMVSFYPDLLLNKVRRLFFTAYSTRLVPAPVWYGLVFLEVALPGVLLTAAFQVLETAWRRLQQRRPGTTPTAQPASRQVRQVQLGLGVGLLIALARSALRLKALSGPVNRMLMQEFAGFLLVVGGILAVLVHLFGLPGDSRQAETS